MSTSRSYHHGDLRAALLATTRDVLAEAGLEGLSLRDVSRRTGVSPAAAYRHFRDKRDLIAALVDDAFAALAAAMRDACRTTDGPADALRRMGVAYVCFAYERPADFKIMFRPELCARRDADAPAPDGEAFALLAQTVAECQAAGIGTGHTRDAAVLAAWSMVHGLASLLVDGPRHDLAPTLAAARRMAQSCSAIVVAGLTGGES